METVRGVMIPSAVAFEPPKQKGRTSGLTIQKPRRHLVLSLCPSLFFSAFSPLGVALYVSFIVSFCLYLCISLYLHSLCVSAL